MESFAVEVRQRTVLIASFDEVIRAIAFKKDEVTSDLLCVQIELADGQLIELNEDARGFEDWLRRVDGLPGADPDWRAKVIQPPFARNETLLFLRQNQGSK